MNNPTWTRRNVNLTQAKLVWQFLRSHHCTYLECYLTRKAKSFSLTDAPFSSRLVYYVSPWTLIRYCHAVHRLLLEKIVLRVNKVNCYYENTWPCMSHHHHHHHTQKQTSKDKNNHNSCRSSKSKNSDVKVNIRIWCRLSPLYLTTVQSVLPHIEPSYSNRNRWQTFYHTCMGVHWHD